MSEGPSNSAPISSGSNQANNNNSNNNTNGNESNDGSGTPKDRHEPRGRKPNDKLPPSRAREVQRAFRLRRAEHLATLEERILNLEQENGSLRALLNLPLADRGRIGSGPTGRGKSLKEGGVPMSERVRARKEARERERRLLGLPMVESSENEDMDTDDMMSVTREFRDSDTLSPRASLPPPPPNTSSLPHLSSLNPSNSASSSTSHLHNNHNQHPNIQQPLFSNSNTNQSNNNNNSSTTNNNNNNGNGNLSPQPFNYQLPIPFNLPVSPDPQFPDFTNTLNTSDLYKTSNNSGSTPNFGGMFSMFDTPSSNDQSNDLNQASSSKNNLSPISPPITNNQNQNQQQNNQQQQQSQSNGGQLDLLTRLKSCCHVSDSHVVNDPGLLVYATRLCQQFGCSFNGTHTDPSPRSDNENLTLEDSWKFLKTTLDPVGDADGENRINTGKMASELVIRAVNSRSGNNINNQSNWIMCRFREGLTVKKSMIQALVQGLGGSLD